MTDKAVIISANKDIGYSTDQVESMTMYQLIGFLSRFDPESRVLIGNNPIDYKKGWYSYTGISTGSIKEIEEDKEGEEI